LRTVGLVAILLLGLANAVSAAPATREQMLQAADTMRAASAVLYPAKQALGIWPGAKIDPNMTGMIGQEYTPMTTTAGTLSNKRTATQPDFAAALAKRMAELGVAKGDKVLIIQSGSFLGGDIAAVAAAEALGADIVLIPSMGASQWGANDLELPLIDILALLLDKGVIHTRPLVAVLGGASGTGRNMEEGSPDILRAAIARRGVPLIDDPVLKTMVDKLTVLVDKALGSRDRLKLMVKVGGSVISTGNCTENQNYTTTIRPRTDPCTGTTPGLLYLKGTEEAPVIHIIDMTGMAKEMGLPYDPSPFPAPGTNAAVYGPAG
jgi:poly-gamma-glutamate system protein